MRVERRCPQLPICTPDLSLAYLEYDSRAAVSILFPDVPSVRIKSSFHTNNIPATKCSYTIKAGLKLLGYSYAVVGYRKVEHFGKNRRSI